MRSVVPARQEEEEGLEKLIQKDDTIGSMLAEGPVSGEIP